MKKIGLIIGILGITFSLFAQGKLSEEKRKEFEAQKVAFFTQEMSLTPEEAVKFWPLYNEMQKKIREAGNVIRDLATKFSGNVTEKEAQANIETILKAEEQMQSLKKDYYQKIIKELSARKLWLMMEAERKFHRQLWKKLGKCPGEKPEKPVLK
ncbi:hypothetical protein [uncultured Sanguibacteroides sp.]|uniref:hypothetical protein n=1 Tax=uncultured Sanguibacteroides sp. TaxID=1635151 RepID=UPI0025E16790|nr:hypothetical protein [uncultured Sanguibacteroides sp.]